MNWKKVVAVGVVLVMIIAFAIYFKGVVVPAIPWQAIKENATTIAAVGAIIAALIAFVVYIGDKKANTYRYLADLYYEILRIGLKYPDFLNPEKTQKYKEAWPPYHHDMYIRYDAYARMCWAHTEDIYDVTWFKKYFRSLYSPTFERYKTLHDAWFQDNTSSFLLPGFVEFVTLNEWRDSLDERKADRLRWSNVVEDYDEKILNPFLPGVSNPLFDYIEKNLNEEKYEVVADFGCGNGKLVKILAENKKFEKVYGIDYSDSMLKMAKKRCDLPNVTYRKMDMTKLEEEMEKIEEDIYGKIDIAFSINSILPRSHKDTPIILHEIYNALKPGGLFIAILPSFDTVLYLKGLWYKDRIKRLEERYEHSIRKLGSNLEAFMDTRREFYKCRKLNKRKHLYADDGSNVQRFIHEKEIKPLLKKAGFEILKKEEVTYPWGLCNEYNYGNFHEEEKEIWDWFVVAKKNRKNSRLIDRIFRRVTWKPQEEK